MRVSIRWLLIVIVVVLFSAGYGYYRMKRPCDIPVVSNFAGDTEWQPPEFVRSDGDSKRIRDTLLQWQQKTQDGYWKDRVSAEQDKKDVLQQRYEVLTQDLNSFFQSADHQQTDVEVVKTYKDTFAPIASQRLNDDRPFVDVEPAYLVLCHTGHQQEAIDYLCGRFLKRIPDDPVPIQDWPFSNAWIGTVDYSKHIAANKAFFAELEALAESGDLPPSFDRLMANAGRPDIGLQRLFQDSQSEASEYSDDEIAGQMLDWVVGNQCELSEKQFDFLLSVCETHDADTATYGLLEIAEPLYRVLKDSQPEGAHKVKRLLRDFHDTLPGEDVSALDALVRIIELDDSDYFYRVLDETKAAKVKGVAITALQGLGFDREVEPAIVKLVESRELSNDFYGEYMDIRGQDAIPFFKARIDELIAESDLLAMISAIGLLGELQRGTRDGETITFLREAFDRILYVGGDQAYSRAHTITNALETVGDPSVGDLHRRLPTPDTAADAMSLHWQFNSHLKTQDLVDYLNAKLNLERPLEATEFNHRGDYWSLFQSLTDTGNAKLLDFGDYSWGQDVELMAYDICELASKQFEVRASVQNESELKLVIDQRLYTAELTDEGAGYLTPCALIDILNAIVASKGESKRFFAYSSCDSDYLTYVTFVEPKVVKELAETFGIKAMDGYEYYLNH